MSYGLIQSPPYHMVVVDKLQIAFSHRFSREYPVIANNMQMDVLPVPYSRDIEHIFHSFLSNIHKNDKEKTTLYSYPATPWEFYKEKYAPKWMLKRWPVRYETKDVVVWSEKNFMCPHISLDTNYPHVLWLLDAQEGKYPPYK
jgi:hypothetical protein